MALNCDKLQQNKIQQQSNSINQNNKDNLATQQTRNSIYDLNQKIQQQTRQLHLDKNNIQETEKNMGTIDQKYDQIISNQKSIVYNSVEYQEAAKVYDNGNQVGSNNIIGAAQKSIQQTQQILQNKVQESQNGKDNNPLALSSKDLQAQLKRQKELDTKKLKSLRDSTKIFSVALSKPAERQVSLLKQKLQKLQNEKQSINNQLNKKIEQNKTIVNQNNKTLQQMQIQMLGF
jgi:hypothetical protein